MAIRALGAIPLATPLANPRKPAPPTRDPAATDATWVPCPFESLGDRNSTVSLMGPTGDASYPPEKNRAPISLRLQLDPMKPCPSSHCPLHRVGIGPMLRSSKLLLSGQTPVSRNPMMVSDPSSERLVRGEVGLSRPRKEGDRVVWMCKVESG